MIIDGKFLPISHEVGIVPFLSHVCKIDNSVNIRLLWCRNKIRLNGQIIRGPKCTIYDEDEIEIDGNKLYRILWLENLVYFSGGYWDYLRPSEISKKINLIIESGDKTDIMRLCDVEKDVMWQR